MIRSVGIIIVLLAVLSIYGRNIQRNMLYYPGTYLPSQESLSAGNIQFWPSASDNYRGFISTPPARGTRGTIIVFHGNAGTAADRVYYADMLTPLGYRVILAEYPGYGGRQGALGEETFMRDAKETLRLAFDRFGGPLFILGESLGCGVAATAAKDPPVTIDGIILITPWDTLLSVAREKFPWIPVRLFLRDKYDTVENLKNYRGRIAVIGAEQDEIIPIHHAQALFKSVSKGQGGRMMRTIKGAGHNDWPETAAPVLWKEITDYIRGDT